MVDMSAAAVSARLERMAEASRLRGRPWAAIDMSLEAVSARLTALGALCDMCLQLRALGKRAREAAG